MSNLKRADIRLDLTKRLQRQIEFGNHEDALSNMLKILKDIPTKSFKRCGRDAMTPEWETLSIVSRCAYELGLWQGNDEMRFDQETWVADFQRKWSQVIEKKNPQLDEFLNTATTKPLTFV